jgi:hypothetical protein
MGDSTITTTPANLCHRRPASSLTEVLIALILLDSGARWSTADVTITFSGFADSQLIPVYQSQGWDVGSEAWYMGGPGGPYYSAYEFRTIAAGGSFYTGSDAIYAPFGQSWFVQIHNGLSFVPDGDTITIAGLGTGGSTSLEIVGFSGHQKVLDETVLTTLAFPGTRTVSVSDRSLISVTSLEFAPARPLNYQITSLDVGTKSPIIQSSGVPELAGWVPVALVLTCCAAWGAFRRLRLLKRRWG